MERNYSIQNDTHKKTGRNDTHFDNRCHCNIDILVKNVFELHVNKIKLNCIQCTQSIKGLIIFIWHSSTAYRHTHRVAKYKRHEIRLIRYFDFGTSDT